MANTSRDFDTRGFALIRGLLTAQQCQALADRVSTGEPAGAGSRALLHDESCEELARRLKRDPVVAGHLPHGAVAVQCTLFDKSAARNWLVAWHQDLSIPVRERVGHSECGGWTEKENMLFVQPPVAVLQTLVAVRVHLDECGPGNGPLRVVPGSHQRGKLGEAEARREREVHGELDCLAGQGDALLMRPLLLHASSKASTPTRRRVLHFLFGPPDLPYGLAWRDAI